MWKKFKKIAILSLILALIGTLVGFVPTIKAAALTKLSDTMSRQKVGVDSDHTILFVTPTGVDATSDTIVVEFDVSGTAFDLTGIVYTDIDLAEDTTSPIDDCSGFTDEVLVNADTAATNEWIPTINTTDDTITFQPAASNDTGATIAAGACVQIEIGTNATYGATGANQINNPGTAGSYQIGFSGTFNDTGTLLVSILSDEQVAVGATVAQSISFAISDLTIGFGTWTGTEKRWATADEAGATAEPAGGLPTQLQASTNAGSGLAITIKSQGDGNNAGLYKSVSPTKLIATVGPSTVAADSEGYAVYGKAATGLTIASGFTATGNTALTTSPQTFVSTTGPVSNGVVDAAPIAAIAATTPAGSYSDALTFVCTGNF